MNQIEIKDKMTKTAQEEKRATKKLHLWSNLRLVMAILVLGGIASFVRSQLWIGLFLGIAGLVAFCYFVRCFNLEQDRLMLLKNKSQVLSAYLARTNGEWQGFAEDGSRFKEERDFVAADLDLVGKRSLFQYISITHTIGGAEALWRLLTKPNLKFIRERQHSVKELLEDDELIIDFEALGLGSTKLSIEEQQQAEAKLRQYAKDTSKKNLQEIRLLAYAMPPLTVAALALALAKLLPLWLFYTCFFAQLCAAFMMSNAIAEEKTMIFTLQKRLANDAARLRVLASKQFKSGYLKEMQAQIQGAEQAILQLNRLVGAWQLRENFILFWPLAGFLAWDFNCMLWLNQWRQKYGQAFGLWLDWIGEIEALGSLGTIARIRPEEVTVPVIEATAQPYLRVKDGKHPLLKPDIVVGNDYEQRGETVIVTGSNMSGKSTFMRMIGVNAILAYAGGLVLAKEFHISPMKILTSMRVSDDVGEGISTFYGEILRIQSMVQFSKEQQPMLALVDEIFKGTNSADRLIGAKAAMEKLTRPWMMTLITTHDFELCDEVNKLSLPGKNYHFKEAYEGNRITFDYKIRTGRCQTTNAQALMRIAGLLDYEKIEGKGVNADVL